MILRKAKSQHQSQNQDFIIFVPRLDFASLMCLLHPNVLMVLSVARTLAEPEGSLRGSVEGGFQEGGETITL